MNFTVKQALFTGIFRYNLANGIPRSVNGCTQPTVRLFIKYNVEWTEIMISFYS